VSGIIVTSGSISITYAGAQANTNALTGATNLLVLEPKISTNNDVVWTCGYKAVVGNDPATGAAGVAAAATTILPKYLPSNCRA
jgi:hypothetical protein